MKKKVSVIVPCYNVEIYINRCLESLVNQTIGIENMQIILINDASTDHTQEQLLKYEQQYPESISVLTLEENVGQAVGRNVGIESAEADYIAFVDADDWLEENFYERLLGAAEESGADLVQAGHYMQLPFVPAKEIRTGTQDQFYSLATEEEKRKFYNERSFYPVWSGIYRSELFKDRELRFYPSRKYEDNYFMGIIRYQLSSYYAISEPLYHYWLHDDSNCHNMNDPEHLVRLEIEIEKLKFFERHGQLDTYYEANRRDFLQGFYCSTLHIIFYRFDELNEFLYKKIQYMQSVVRQLFPDYMEVYNENPSTKFPILTVSFDYSIEEWREIRKSYLDFCENGSREGHEKLYSAILSKGMQKQGN